MKFMLLVGANGDTDTLVNLDHVHAIEKVDEERIKLVMMGTAVIDGQMHHPCISVRVPFENVVDILNPYLVRSPLVYPQEVK